MPAHRRPCPTGDPVFGDEGLVDTLCGWHIAEMTRFAQRQNVAVARDDVSLRPIEEADLDALGRFSLEPDALGEFQWAGYTDPRGWRRRWDENGMLGEDSSTLAVVG